jgi:hypothetical protein
VDQEHIQRHAKKPQSECKKLRTKTKRMNQGRVAHGWQNVASSLHQLLAPWLSKSNFCCKQAVE